MKKNKDIEVTVREEERVLDQVKKNVQIVQVGKNEAGIVVPLDNQKFQAIVEDEQPITVKTVNEAIEFVLRAWNLNH